MKRLAAAVLLFFVSACATVQPPQQAAAPTGNLVASFAAPNTNGRLYDGPCQNDAVLAVIPPQFRAMAQAAEGAYEGKEFGVCWLWRPDGAAVVVVWDDGGAFTVPRSMLKFPVGV
jgi:hypothetical protein